MPKIQIDVPDDVYKQLKAQAKIDDRSLTKYLTRGLKYLADIPGGYHQTLSTTVFNSAIPSIAPDRT